MNLFIRPVKTEDLPTLKSILEEHVRDGTTHEIERDEIESILGYMEGKQDEYGRLRSYLVAEHEGNVIGCMAYSDLDPAMKDHFGDKYQNSQELLNAFVTAEHFRGKGVGRALLDKICEEVKNLGFEYLVVNSGPRYKLSWGFYDKYCDSDLGFIKNKYGVGVDAKTWYKKL